MTGSAKQSTFRVRGPMDCFACARNDGVKRHLAPLAGRGRRRREAKSPGEGDYPQVRAWLRLPLTRSQDARDLSPQAGRGEERPRVLILTAPSSLRKQGPITTNTEVITY